MATLEVDKAVTHVAEIVRHGEALTIPEKMTFDQAVALILKRKEYDEQPIQVNRRFDARWEEGAIALNTVLTRLYGWSPHTHSTQTGMFGMKSKTPPQMLSIDVAYGKRANVPWGSFLIPGTEAMLDMEAYNGKRFGMFAVTGQVKRKWESEVNRLLDAVRDEIASSSLYRGKAWLLSADDSFQPHFVDTECDPSQLIFSKAVWDAVETSVFTPLQRYGDLKASGLPFKRGIGLVGDFGTGKTLAAKVASHYAVEAGITFIICKEAKSIGVCVEYARAYQPAVVFVEDIDRELEGERTDVMDMLLNTIDGIDGKKAEVMIVYTSNNVKGIHKAALRPGRTDAVIEIIPPDTEAVERLIRYYGKGVVAESENITEAAALLSGHIPAVIAEVVKRAKLSMLKMTPKGERVRRVNGEALREAAQTMKLQLDLLYEKPDAHPPITIETLVTNAVQKGFDGHVELTKEIAKSCGVEVYN